MEEPPLPTDSEDALKVAGATHPGMKRDVNEDSLHVDEELGLFIIADGLGGHNAGEVASSMAVKRISRFIRDGLAAGKDPEALVPESILEAHHAIMQHSVQDPLCGDMGTTVVLALLADDHFLICHVGDSRAYTISDATITALTTDHSFVAEWIERGEITPEEARTHSARHGLTMALGVDDAVEPVVACLPWKRDACLLLCSDGLVEMMEDHEILEVVKSANSPRSACDRLVEIANEKGGRDNVTVVVVCP